MELGGERDHILKQSQVRPELVVSLLLVVSILYIFSPLRHNEFIKFDDDLYVTENQYVQEGLSIKGVIWAFTSTRASNWHPLTWLSHMADCHMYGLNPGMHHTISLILHILNSLLIFWFFNRITGSMWPSALVAALFGLHPINVDSVAWIAERKNLLSTFFCMLALLTYTHFVKRRRMSTYLMVLLLFALSLMTKPILVTLPFVLLMLDYWFLRCMAFYSEVTIGDENPTARVVPKRMDLLSLVVEKIPFVLLAAVSVFISGMLVQNSGIVVSHEMRPMSLRIANALVSYVSYIGKMVWPHDLTIFYPYPKSVPFWKSGFAFLILCGISIYAVRHLKTKPYLGFGWFWFLGTLFPFIGLAQAGLWPSMADRWAYVSFIGLFVAVAWTAKELTCRIRYGMRYLWIILPLALFLMGSTTYSQAKIWRNSISLFTHALSVTRDNYVIHNNLANALKDRGLLIEAEKHYSEALQIRPDFYRTRYNLANLLKSQGRLAEAIPHYAEVLQSQPDYAPAHNNLGTALIQISEIEKIIAFSATESKNRDDANTIRHLLAKARASRKEIDAAVFHFTRALQIDPDADRVAANLEMAREFRRKFDDALVRLESAGSIR